MARSCKDSKGKFMRCPGAPAPKRPHRKTAQGRKGWAGCGCPKDSKRVVNRRKGGRGWSCVKQTAKGPRFVKATCP